ncbi:PAS domain S-box protein [Desulfobacterales bacterium HSG16]|nr:PAS domain S-box protein [Desulfobacterales bacterium HSG16]
MKLFNFIKNLRIRYKLQIIYSFVFAISLIVGGMVIYSFVQNTIEKKIEKELGNSTNSMLNMVKTAATVSVRNYLRATAEKNLDIVRHFYSLYTSGKMTEEEAISLSSDILLSQRIGKTGYIYCINSLGIMDFHPKKNMKGNDFSNLWFVKEQIKKKEGYLEYEWKNNDEEKARYKALYMKHFAPWDWIISVSSYQEEFSEIINLNDFRESILSLKFGETGYSYLLDYKGNILIHPYYEGHNFYDRKDANGKKFIAEICMKKTGKTIYSWKNLKDANVRDKLAIFHDIPEFGWIFASSGYLDEFYKPMETVKFIIIATIVITMILVFMISSYISSLMTRPLHTLMGHFAKGASGDLSVRMTIRSEDEIGKLSQFFNIFMEKLESSANALLESENKYRSLFENAIEGIFQSTKDGRFLSLNPSLAKLCGYDSPEEMTTHIKDMARQLYVYPENRQQFIRMVEKQEYVEGFETLFYKKNGNTIWVAIYARCVRNKDGEILFYEGSFVDISKRKQIEEELKQHRDNLEEKVRQRTLELTSAKEELEYSEKKFRTLFEDTGDAMMTLDHKGFIDCNPSFLEIFGCRSRKELLGKHPSEFSPKYQPDGRNSAILSKQRMQTAFSTGSCLFEWEHMRMDGRHFPAEVLLSSMEIGEKNILQAVVRDITDRRISENAIKESQRRLSDIIDFLPDPTFMIDNEGKVSFWNKAIEKITGISADDIIGKGDYEYAIPFYGHRRPILINLVSISSDELNKKYPRLQRDGNVLTGEAFTPNLGENGAYLFATATSLFDSKGNTMGAIESIRDISDRKKMEDDLNWQSDLNRVFADLSRALLSMVSLDEISHLVLENAKRLTQSKFGFVGSIEKSTNDLTKSTMSEDVWDECKITDKNFIMKKFGGMWGWVLNEKTALMTNEPDKDPRSTGVPPGHMKIDRFLSVPAVIGEKLLGIIALANASRDYKNQDIDVIQRMSDLYAIAVDRISTEMELEEAKETAEGANKKIIESLNYAKTIQTSLLANLDKVKNYIPHSLFIWKPRDIVGGDIFFTDCFDDGFIVAVIDCTGHGVPGAFMTMIVFSALRRIIKDERCHNPAEILEQLNLIVKTTLHQDQEYGNSDDGLDIGICFIKTNDTKQDKASCLIFAGARLPLYYVQNEELTIIKGDKQSIGYKRSDLNFKFTNHIININEHKISFYMTTDGFIDQLGGEKERRFGTARFKKILKNINSNHFENQRDMLLDAFYEYKGDQERQDDVTVVGFMVK